MLWFVCALSTAFFESLKDVRSKQILRYLDEYWVAWATQVVGDARRRERGVVDERFLDPRFGRLVHRDRGHCT